MSAQASGAKRAREEDGADGADDADGADTADTADSADSACGDAEIVSVPDKWDKCDADKVRLCMEVYDWARERLKEEEADLVARPYKDAATREWKRDCRERLRCTMDSSSETIMRYMEW